MVRNWLENQKFCKDYLVFAIFFNFTEEKEDCTNERKFEEYELKEKKCLCASFIVRKDLKQSNQSRQDYGQV